MVYQVFLFKMVYQIAHEAFVFLAKCCFCDETRVRISFDRNAFDSFLKWWDKIFEKELQSD